MLIIVGVDPGGAVADSLPIAFVPRSVNQMVLLGPTRTVLGCELVPNFVITWNDGDEGVGVELGCTLGRGSACPPFPHPLKSAAAVAVIANAVAGNVQRGILTVQTFLSTTTSFSKLQDTRGLAFASQHYEIPLD